METTTFRQKVVLQNLYTVYCPDFARTGKAVCRAFCTYAPVFATCSFRSSPVPRRDDH